MGVMNLEMTFQATALGKSPREIEKRRGLRIGYSEVAMSTFSSWERKLS